MYTAFMVAFLFSLIGVVLICSGWQSLKTGAAETDDNGTLYKQRQPLRFWLFVVTQMAFGVFAVIVGIMLFVLTMIELAG